MWMFFYIFILQNILLLNQYAINKTLKNKYLYTFCIIFAYWLSFASMLQAQIIKGRITDINGKPVSNASLFIKEIKLGTAANEDGYYELKIATGTYTCTFQCLGYETVTRTVTVGTSVSTLDITLQEKAYEIKEVVISNNSEDPAYGIMRRAIAMAPYYMNQISEYKADVYLKGSLHIIKISKLVKRLAKEELEGFKEGNTYLEESFNEIEFTAPNQYKQKVLKRTGSMPQQNEGGSAMELITASVYDPKAIEPSISPLSSSAFAHYNFRYEGFIEEGDRVINKIKIIPKHKSKQLISGYIYIADNYWNIHSLDIDGQFPIGGNYHIQINFSEVNENVWLPVSHRIDFNGSILGNKGDFHYVSSVKYTHIKENTSLRKPDALLLAEQQRKAMQRYEAPPVTPSGTKPAQNKNSQKIEKILAKEDISNREAYKLARLMQKEADAEKKDAKSLNLSETLYENYKVEVDSSANQRDTAYWEKMRPVPLSPPEVRSYQEKETREVGAPQFREQTKDTVRREKRQSPFIRTSKKILFGTNIVLGKKGGIIEYRGLNPSKLGFNTVDGFFIGQKITYYKDFAPTRRENRLSVTPQAVWAINRQALMWDVNTSLTYAPLKRGSAKLSFGQKTSDFNEQRGMYPFENTIASLFFRRNYLKLYKNVFVEAGNTIDIANGLQLTTNIQYTQRTMLENHSDYSFFYRDSREYTPNTPQNAELTYPLTDHTNTSFTINIQYTPQFYYRIDRNNRKRMVKSDFPTIHLGWRKGLKDVFNSDSNYDLLYGAVTQRIETGFMQQLRYQLGGGIFVNRKSIYFPDFYHFRTLEIPVTIGNIESSGFNLLEYYRYSTSDKYIIANVYYTTPFLILKYLPFFNNRVLWDEGIQLNYLYTPEMKNYVELGYTIGIIWKAGVFVGFENFKYRSVGVRLSLPITLFVP